MNFTASNKDTETTIALTACLTESSNTWIVSTSIDYVEYSAENVIFHEQIKTSKSVSKMLQLCKDNISYEIKEDSLLLSIYVDYIDDSILHIELTRVPRNYEEILLKRMCTLEEKILFLERENAFLKDLKDITSNSIQGSFWIELHEPKNTFTYDFKCKRSTDRKSFKLKLLNAFKSCNISNLVFLNSYCSEGSSQAISTAIKKIAIAKNLHEIKTVVDSLTLNKVDPLVSLTYYDANGTRRVIGVANSFKVLFQCPSSSNQMGGWRGSTSDVEESYSYHTSKGYMKFYDLIYDKNCVIYNAITGATIVPDNDIFIAGHIKFASSCTKTLNDIKAHTYFESIDKIQDVIYDSFGNFYEYNLKEMKGPTVYYIFDE